MINTKNITYCLIFGVLIILSACQADGNYTGTEYMPDMVHSQAYEVYVPGPGNRDFSNQPDILTETPFDVFADGKVAREPVSGTIPRGFKPYPYQNTDEGYEASASLVNPYAYASADDLAVGKKHYTTYCGVCHGESGKGDGSISASGPKSGPFAGIINYYSAAYLQMEEGKMFHSMHYGKNNMGSYASQLSKEERWKIVSYIKSMQAKEAKKSNKDFTDMDALEFVRGGVAGMGKSMNAAMSDDHHDDHHEGAGAEHGDEHHHEGDGTHDHDANHGHENADHSHDTASTGNVVFGKYGSKELKKGSKIVLENVLFKLASAKIKDGSKDELATLTAAMKANKNLRIEIGGHTDDTGLDKKNMELSTQRAKAVMDYLIEQGISSTRLQYKGYGGSQPLYKDLKDRAKNRRVEFKVL